ncbi:hypothetical protein [Roseomonas sp. WA12]
MLYDEKMVAPFPKGTFANMDAVLKDGEARTDLVRTAVEREIEHRRSSKKPKGAADKAK